MERKLFRAKKEITILRKPSYVMPKPVLLDNKERVIRVNLDY